jgi:hypothetical protein
LPEIHYATPMRNKKTLLLFVCVMSITSFYGQSKQVDTSITVSYEKSGTNDTVWLYVNTLPTTKPGTLMLITTINNSIKTDTAFFPIIDTASVFSIVIPAAYLKGVLSLKAFFYPKIFQITGKVLERVKSKIIKALLITDNQKLYNKELNISDDNEFELPSLVFKNKASLIFNYISDKRTDHPDVNIEQVPSVHSFTDSIFAAIIPLAVPAATADNNSPSKTAPVNYSSIPAADSIDKFQVLHSVTVVGTRKTNAQKFNEQYTTPLFNDLNEKIVDCIDNDGILSYPDCLSYLQSQIAGIMPSVDKFGQSILKWRGHETKAFFIDEIGVDIDQLLSVNVADIAIIKAFPPPFFGSNGNGDGGAIAIYTKRGEYRTTKSSDNKWLFSIKGYSPAIHTLFSDK